VRESAWSRFNSLYAATVKYLLGPDAEGFEVVGTSSDFDDELDCG
jgi:hypothetical protein